jgi:multidrug efflux system membrane fusion protein
MICDDMITSPVERSSESPRTRDPETRPPRELIAAEPSAIPADASADGPAKSRGRTFFFWLVLLTLGAGAWHYRPIWLPLIPTGAAAPPRNKSAGRAVPVRTAVVRQQDMDVYLDGLLGTVTAFKSVTIKSRVDGELVKVAFTEGQIVKEGDLLAEIDPRPFDAQLQQAEGQLARDQATLELAKLTLARGQGLLKTKSIAPQQVDEQVAQVDQMEGTILTDQALVDNARLQLRYCRIIAPIGGRIGLRLVDQGNMVHANDATGLAVITQFQPISLVFPISQDDIPRVLKAMRDGRSLRVDAYDRDLKLMLATGTLAAVDNQVDSTTGTLRLKATFENKDNMLFPNQFVNTRLLVDTRKGALVVPSAAIQHGPSFTFVYVVKSGETVELRQIETGPSEGVDTVVESGLSAGETVVTDGIDKLQNKSKVTIREPSSSAKKAKPESEKTPDEGDAAKPPETKADRKSQP